MSGLNLRRIGGSDAPAIVGYYYPEIRAQLPERYSAYAVWARIVHGVHVDDPDLAEHARWGKRLEEPIFRGWLFETRRDPAEWTWCGDQTRDHPKRDWQRISPDAVSGCPGFGGEVADIKFPNPFAASDMRDGITPVQYEIQLQTYMEALDLERAWLVPLIGGAVHEIAVPRSEVLCRTIVECCERFWKEHILTDVPPAPDASAHTARAIERRHLRIGAARPPRRATEAEVALAEHLRIQYHTHSAAEEMLNATKNALRESIGDADAIELPGEGKKRPKITNRLQAGRDTTNWFAVCRDLNSDATAVTDAIARNTAPGTPFRVLRHPYSREK